MHAYTTQSLPRRVDGLESKIASYENLSVAYEVQENFDQAAACRDQAQRLKPLVDVVVYAPHPTVCEFPTQDTASKKKSGICSCS